MSQTRRAAVILTPDGGGYIKALGLTLPQALVGRADEVIE